MAAIGEHDPIRFVFVDEASANTTLTARYGRAPKDQRASGAALRNYRHNTTLAAGLRQGEYLGLAWGDVDLSTGRLTVTHQLQWLNGSLTLTEPKSRSGRRALVLPQMATDALRAHRTAQLEARMQAGSSWEDSGLIFTTQTGGPLDPRNAARTLTWVLAGTSLAWVGVHTLRHSFASMLAAAGVHPRTAMEL